MNLYNNQEGVIPVIMLLQQLDTIFGNSGLLYTTAMSLQSNNHKFGKCETDFIALLPKHYSGRIQIAIGECKTSNLVEKDDVSNLQLIAEKFPKNKFDIFIIFAKLTEFTEKEIRNVMTLKDKSKIILLTARELEPYFLYERITKEFNFEITGGSFEGMAQMTQNIYFKGKKATVMI